MSSKVKVILHGYLKDLCQSGLEFSGATAAEVINGLCKQTKAFNVNFDQPKHRIKVVGFPTKDSLYAPLAVTELHLVPQMNGGKSGGFVQIVVGTVLIATAFALAGPAGLAAAGSFSAAGVTFSLGLSLVLGGLLQLISPAPKMDGSGNVQDPEGSKYLGSGQNTVAIGTRIPLLYGKHLIYGHFLSFDIDAVDVASTT